MRRFTLFTCSLALGLTACGGGGGGDGASGVSNARSPVPVQTRLTYAGATTAAAVGNTTAAPLAANVIGSTGAALGASLLRGSGGGAVSRSVACDAGSINIAGSVDNAGQGTATVDYIDCRTGPNTLNGPAALTIRGYDAANGIVTDGTLNFTRARFFGPSGNFDITGTVDVQVSVSSARMTLTQSIVTQDNNSSAHQTQSDLTFVNTYLNSTVVHPTFFNQSISGSVCDGSLGCVTVSTTTAAQTDPWGPLYFATSSQAFPDWGIINLASGATRARVTSLGVDLAKFEIDSGSGTFGTPARLRWSELTTAIGANLADSDGDGMHDSYEVAAGLNPSVNDANGDADSDGFSNYTEYLAGTNAGTNGSVPVPVRHLWVTNVDGLAESGGQIAVFVNSQSSGVMLDPITGELTAATFSSGITPSASGTTSAPDAQGRTFTITAGTTSGSYVITSSTGASLTISSVGGTNPTSLIRYGAHGLAFRTIGTASPGYIYLVESAYLVP